MVGEVDPVLGALSYLPPNLQLWGWGCWREGHTQMSTLLLGGSCEGYYLREPLAGFNDGFVGALLFGVGWGYSMKGHSPGGLIGKDPNGGKD